MATDYGDVSHWTRAARVTPAGTSDVTIKEAELPVGKQKANGKVAHLVVKLRLTAKNASAAHEQRRPHVALPAKC